MNDKFDELAKGLAQSVTRRGALKKFGFGLAGIALASLGLANKAEAQSNGNCRSYCKQYCAQYFKRHTPEFESCFFDCLSRGCY